MFVGNLFLNCTYNRDEKLKFQHSTFEVALLITAEICLMNSNITVAIEPFFCTKNEPLYN